MADERRKERTRRLLSLPAGRLAENRWMLVVGIAVIGVLGVAAEAKFAWIAFAVLVLFAAALLVPAGRPRRKISALRAAAADGGGLGGLSAQSLAAAVSDPLIIFDASGTAVHVNAAARAAFGAISPGLSLLMKFRTPELRAAIENIRAASGPTVVEYAERVPIERIYKVTVSAIGGGSGLYVVVFEDQSQARRIDRMRADFIANASHELRTPLASISGFVETLRGPARNDAKARDHFLQIMQSQTERMARLIDDLLSLSRLEMKPYLPPGIAVDIGQVVQSVIDSLSPLARESGVEIEWTAPENPSSQRGTAMSFSRSSRTCWKMPANTAGLAGASSSRWTGSANRNRRSR
jgi:two-component system phosphate regulon sensor histidine kinase PhoR